MPFDFQPTLKGELLELRPLRAEDFHSLYAVASDPRIWEQHPIRDRYQLYVVSSGRHRLRFLAEQLIGHPRFENTLRI
jgi:hypothetical protein